MSNAFHLVRRVFIITMPNAAKVFVELHGREVELRVELRNEFRSRLPEARMPARNGRAIPHTHPVLERTRHIRPVVLAQKLRGEAELERVLGHLPTQFAVRRHRAPVEIAQQCMQSCGGGRRKGQATHATKPRLQKTEERAQPGVKFELGARANGARNSVRV
eukprot:2573659-Pleurochrysis_carterae.AAC.1